MSLKVLVIPEDFRKDQYILGPVLQRLLREIGKPQAKLTVCKDPLLGGIDQALSWPRLEEIILMYPMVDLFLVIVDRDGDTTRINRLTAIETKATTLLGEKRLLLAEHAWQEIEVWGLAGQVLPKSWSWKSVRDEKHPKEAYFAPHAASRKLLEEPGEGRTTMGREAALNYSRVRSLCQEDIVRLESRLADWFKTH